MPGLESLSSISLFIFSLIRILFLFQFVSLPLSFLPILSSSLFSYFLFFISCLSLLFNLRLLHSLILLSPLSFLISLSNYRSISLSFYLSITLELSFSFALSISISTFLTLCLSIALSYSLLICIIFRPRPPKPNAPILRRIFNKKNNYDKQNKYLEIKKNFLICLRY